ncbi:MAG TPA: GNAT family N-acetyltransferase, partial [Nocardioidaceae bacterium]|nr:GNAT family N-acetyltransferase [Nocardioidaceae bacterium]
MDGLLIRLARPEELARAGEIVVEAYRAGGFLDNAEVGYAEKLADTASRASTAELYVALLDGDVVGCVTYCPNGTIWGEIARPDEGEFRMLGVAEAARGHGIGLALTERCLERSRELWYGGVVLSSLPRMTSAH